ncbi:MAG: DNA polymerase III subunit delta' [Gilvibacter sp.]
MLFSTVLGQEHLKTHLQQSAQNGRVPHAQLFVGPLGVGLLSMALAYSELLLEPAPNSTGNKVAQLTHPDLHFVFPVATTDKVKKHPVSSNFLEAWRSFVHDNPYASLFEWYQHLGIENKQGRIGVDEAQDMVKKLSLKAYAGEYKVMIVWMAEKMNTECANKILKLVEEPPDKTVLLLLTENEEHILGTIKSRCQVLHFPFLSVETIAHGLIKNHDITEAVAMNVAKKSEGDFNQALHLLHHDGQDIEFEKWFLYWVRTAFKAKGNKMAINDLLSWSEEVAKSGRETQKKFLRYCLELFRDGMLVSYGAGELVFYQPEDPNFSLEKFAPFIHEGNIFEITNAVQDAIYHIERNGNSKIILADLAIELTRYIHKKPA